MQDPEVTRNATVVKVGAQIATAHCGENNPIGKTVLLNGVGFRVVGVMETKGGNGFGSALASCVG